MSAPQITDKEFQRISTLMYDSIGLSFGDSKLSLIQSRLVGRIQRLGFDNFADYIAILEDESEGAEFQIAVDLLTTNETYFFREPKHFELLEQELANLGPRVPIRIWSAASSFGDEPYTIAMLLSELQVQGRIGSQWSILATDISHRALISAKAGVYPIDRLRAVPKDYLRRYCLRGEGDSEGQVMIQDKVRERVQFGQLNLCKALDIDGPFDAIFLRNVLIYFDQATKIEVVDRVCSLLKTDGLFFLGTAEGRVPCRTPLKPVIPGAFRKATA